MSARGGDYSSINGSVLSEHDGARLDLIAAQLFFNSFATTVTADVTSSAVIGIPESSNVTSSAVINTTNTRDVTSSAVITDIVTSNVTSSAVVGTSHTRDATSSAVITIIHTDDVTSSAVVGTTHVSNVTSSAVISISHIRDVTSSAVIKTINLRNVTSSAVIATEDSRGLASSAVIGIYATHDIVSAAVISAAVTCQVIGRLVDVYGVPIVGATLSVQSTAPDSFFTRIQSGLVVARVPITTVTGAGGYFTFRIIRPDIIPEFPDQYLLTGPGVRIIFRTRAHTAYIYFNDNITSPSMTIQKCTVSGNVSDISGSSRANPSIDYGHGDENLFLLDGTIVQMRPKIIYPDSNGDFSVSLIRNTQFAVA